jgi:hypothetical protein
LCHACIGCALIIRSGGGNISVRDLIVAAAEQRHGSLAVFG